MKDARSAQNNKMIPGQNRMNTRECQTEIAKVLKRVYRGQSVEVEWDSVKYDNHFSNHKFVYGPRIGIAVGPFNSYADLDIGNDRTRVMQSHPFTTRLFEAYFNVSELDEVWNEFSRCYLAVEVEFSGSPKHILGDIVNASVSGSIGLVIGTRDNIEEIKRAFSYVLRLEYLERMNIHTLNNDSRYDDVIGTYHIQEAG